jgi:hypothetical protein
MSEQENNTETPTPETQTQAPEQPQEQPQEPAKGKLEYGSKEWEEALYREALTNPNVLNRIKEQFGTQTQPQAQSQPQGQGEEMLENSDLAKPDGWEYWSDDRRITWVANQISDRKANEIYESVGTVFAQNLAQDAARGLGEEAKQYVSQAIDDLAPDKKQLRQINANPQAKAMAVKQIQTYARGMAAAAAEKAPKKPQPVTDQAPQEKPKPKENDNIQLRIEMYKRGHDGKDPSEKTIQAWKEAEEKRSRKRVEK